MSRSLNMCCAKASTAVVGWIATLVLSTGTLAQQGPSTNFPTAVISSGGLGAEPSPHTSLSGDSNASSAWTAERNPVSGNLRPNETPTYPALPVIGPAVVTAAAQGSLASEHALGSSPQTGGLTTAAGGANLEDAKHIPLAPPSDRFKGETPAPASSTVQTFISVGSSLLLVVGLFLGVAWCYRKTLSTSIGGGLPKQVVQVMGRSSISARQQMVLVRFGSKLLLVSVIQGEARTLSEITDPLEVDQLVGLCESGQPGSITNSFRSVLLQEGSR